MQIMTNRGKTFEADWTLLTETRNGAKQLVIQLPGDTDLHEVINELVGVDTIRESKGDGECPPHEGYTQFASLIYSTDRKAMRLTLERSDGNG